VFHRPATAPGPLIRGLASYSGVVRWQFDNSFVRELPWLGVRIDPVPVRAPELLALNEPLARELGLDPDWLGSDEGVAVLAGNVIADGSEPIAQAYAGHQFGQLSPLLGDGRAHLLGEIVDVAGRRRDVALKGSGPTPFSRAGDGRAAVGPVLREFLVSEAMAALGVPTTRSLAAVATGEPVRRERSRAGAVLTRVAASHVRVGTVQLVASRGGRQQLAELVEYVRARHYPDLPADDPIALLEAVAERQAALIAYWMAVGFVHGVMNTDNMTLSGETIDYGPCAFLDGYDPHAVFSSIDSFGRYRFDAQPRIGAWNLARLAEALLPLANTDDDVTRATEVIDEFEDRCEGLRLHRLCTKLGLNGTGYQDAALVADLLQLMEAGGLDFTGTFRSLSGLLRGVPAPLAQSTWAERWRDRLGPIDPETAARRLDAVNPVHIPRNHLVENALAHAELGDMTAFHELLSAVQAPFQPRATYLAEPAPNGFTADYVTYCGT